MSKTISKKKEKEKVFVKSIMAALILHTRTMERVMLIRTYCHVKSWKFKELTLLKYWYIFKKMNVNARHSFSLQVE